MNTYVGQILGNRYPFPVKIQATSWTAAVGRAARLWAKAQGKGSRTDRLVVSLTIIRPIDFTKEPVEKIKRIRVKRGMLGVGGR